MVISNNDIFFQSSQQCSQSINFPKAVTYHLQNRMQSKMSFYPADICYPIQKNVIEEVEKYCTWNKTQQGIYSVYTICSDKTFNKQNIEGKTLNNTAS